MHPEEEFERSMGEWRGVACKICRNHSFWPFEVRSADMVERVCVGAQTSPRPGANFTTLENKP